MKRRVYIFAIFVLVWFLLIVSRIYYMKTTLRKHYTELLKIQNLYKRTELARRGDILDRNCKILAKSVERFSVFADVKNIKDKRKISKILSDILKLPEDKILKKLNHKKGFRNIVRFIPSEVAYKLKEILKVNNIKSIYLMNEYKRYYPNSNLMCHILGGVKFEKGEEKGLLGIEQKYENFLKGENGIISYERDALGRIKSYFEIKKSHPGDTLILTTDIRLQYITQKALSDGIKKSDAKGGIAIVMNPETGEILSYACYPDFNPNDLKHSDPESLKNTGITDVYEPGSTFKTITLSAALEEGTVTLKDKIFCNNGKISISNVTIHDHHSFGNLTVTDILTFSSDIGIIKIAMKMDDYTFFKYLKKFGIGDKTGIDLPGESRGILRDYKYWGKISRAYYSMGQGIAVTPMQMVRAYCAVANGGFLVRPFIVKSIFSPDGKPVKITKIVKKRIIFKDTSKKVKYALMQVVERGTGKRASIPGYYVAGKTGTAQVFDKKINAYSKKDYFSSFIGFVPVKNPKFVIGVFVISPKNGIYGGEIAAPVFREIAKKCLKIYKIPEERKDNLRKEKKFENPEIKNKTLVKNFQEKSKDSWEKNQDIEGESNILPNLPKDEPEPETIEYDFDPGKEEKIKVSDFRGLNIRECLKLASEKGLKIEKIIFTEEKDSNNTVKFIKEPHKFGSGIVYRQCPQPGANVRKNTECTIYVTHDPEKIMGILKEKNEKNF